MDARYYLDQIVVPTIKEYATNITSVRHALLACLATFHTVDYLAAPKRPGNLRKELGEECPSFALIDEIAHAFKHVSSSKSGLTVDGVISRPPAAWGTATWGLSRWGDAFGGVTLNANRDVDLLAELNTALSFLRSQLAPVEDKWIVGLQSWAASETLVRKVYLFGSRIRGNHNAGSDLDIAISCAGVDAAERDSNFICNADRWRKALSAVIPVKIDLYPAEPERGPVVWSAVMDHGRKIYPVTAYDE